jgi:general secretion pathway protein L
LDAEFEPEDLSGNGSAEIDAASSLLDLRLDTADLTLPVADRDTDVEADVAAVIKPTGLALEQPTVPTVILERLRSFCQANGIVLEQEVYHDEPLRYYADHFRDNDALNILQGEYSRKEQLEKMFRPWIPTAAVAATWLLIQGGLLIANYINLAGREEQLIAQMDEIYADAFPEAKQTKFHLREMKGRLAKLKTDEEKDSGFIPLLFQTGQVLKDTQNMSISGIRYKSNKLDITMEISDLQALDALKENLITKAEVNVEIVSASAREGKVNSRIQVEPKT